MAPRIATLLLAGVALLAIGCAPASPPSGPSPAPDHIWIVVNNHNWSDMTVLVTDGIMEQRLGRVGSMNAGRFRLPAAIAARAGTLRLIAVPLAGSVRYTSQTFNVWPGGRAEWTLENQVGLSSVIAE